MTSDINTIRENLVMLKAYVRHWTDDAGSNMAPTPGTLTNANTLVLESLSRLNRIEAERSDPLITALSKIADQEVRGASLAVSS